MLPSTMSPNPLHPQINEKWCQWSVSGHMGPQTRYVQTCSIGQPPWPKSSPQVFPPPHEDPSDPALPPTFRHAQTYKVRVGKRAVGIRLKCYLKFKSTNLLYVGVTMKIVVLNLSRTDAFVVLNSSRTVVLIVCLTCTVKWYYIIYIILKLFFLRVCYSVNISSMYNFSTLKWHHFKIHLKINNNKT